MTRLDAQPRFEGADEGFEEIDEQGIGPAHDLADFLVHQGGEDDRLAVTALGGDAREALLDLFHAVDEGQGDLVELDAFELRQQAVAQHLRRDARAIGDEEHGAALRHGG